jgi:hypothetical protein
MPRPAFLTIAISLALTFPLFAQAEDNAGKVAAQKKGAQDNWSSLDLGESAHLETAHLLIFAPKSLEKRLKDAGNLLEKVHDQARSALKYEDKDDPWSGKLTVYLFTDRDSYTKFVRRIEQRRLDSDDLASFSLPGERPHVAACPSKNKRDPNLEGLAAGQIACALMQKKAGADVALPAWLLSGFGRATLQRATPTERVTKGDRQLAAKLVKLGRTAMDVCAGKLDRDEAPLLDASLMDYLAYGPGSAKLSKVLNGFKPEDNVPMKTTLQALENAGLTLESLNTKWLKWVISQ